MSFLIKVCFKHALLQVHDDVLIIDGSYTRFWLWFASFAPLPGSFDGIPTHSPLSFKDSCVLKGITLQYSILYSIKSVLLMKIYIGSERGAKIYVSIKMRLFSIQPSVFVVINNNNNNNNHHYYIFIYIFIPQQPSILTPHASSTTTTTTTIFYVFTIRFEIRKFLYHRSPTTSSFINNMIYLHQCHHRSSHHCPRRYDIIITIMLLLLPALLIEGLDIDNIILVLFDFGRVLLLCPPSIIFLSCSTIRPSRQHWL